VKAVRGKLWELRVRAGRARYRILYFAFVGQRFVLLHGFVKKTANTPRREIEIAERRMVDFIARPGA
jgi:phage-related protein